MEIASGVYKPRDPRTTGLYEVVPENLETLYGAIEDGAIAVRIPKHARKELEAYLSCGLPEVRGVRGEAGGGVQLQGPGICGLPEYAQA